MEVNLVTEAFDLIHDIALTAVTECGEPIPKTIVAALNEIVALARYKGVHGNLVPITS